MEVISEIVDAMIELIQESIGFSIRFLNVLFWAIAGAFILPCVFIAGNVYPKWEKWAENLKK